MPDVRLSKLAIASFVGALFGPTLLMPVLIGMSLPRSPFARAEWVGPVFLAGVVVLGITATMGLVSIIRIERSGGRITGRPFAIAAALAWVFGAFLIVIWPVMVRPRSTAYRMVCGTNLSGLGKAMLIYANDYDEQYPRAGGKNSVWAAKTPNWQATNRYEAFNLNADATGGQASISASLYLLVKYAQAKPKQFVCTKDSGTKEFTLG